MINLTKEQEDILSTKIVDGEKNITIVKALAGTGKTTTLIEKVIKHPELKFCYLSFNRAIKEEICSIIKSKKIENLTSYTMHGLAWKTVMQKFGYPPIITLTVESIQRMFPYEYSLQKVWIIYKIILLFNKYCGQVLSFEEYKESVLNMTPLEFSYLGFTEDNINLFHTCFGYVEKIYNKLLSKTAGFITHNFYLKYFIDNLSEFDFSDFDVFLFDEAQDLNEPMAVFVRELVKINKPIILMGDNHQSIYSFIKSIDVMSLLEEQLPERVVPKKLTNSFRFSSGTKIEELCNHILEVRGEKIKGYANYKEQDIVTTAYLSRANKPIFSKCLELINEGETFDLIGGIESFDIKTISDIYCLLTGFIKNIKNKYIASFSYADAFLKEISENNDIDLASKYLIADICYTQHKSPDTIFKLISDNIDIQSNIKVGTIHKTKGLGFDCVKILDGGHNTDIIGLSDEKKITHKIDDVIYKVLTLQQDVNIYEELNILYVGLSRAKKELILENTTYINTLEFIKKTKENSLQKILVPHLWHNKEHLHLDDTTIVSQADLYAWQHNAKGKKKKKI